MIPATIEVDGSLSSQFLTGLLMAYSASPNSSEGGALENVETSDISIKVRNLKSKPYIDLTLDVMKKFGMRLPENKNYEEFIFSTSTPVSQLPTPDYTVEGDWSGGAFLLVAGAIAGPIIVKGLDINSTQADRQILEAMKCANVDLVIGEGEIKIQPGELKGFEFDATDCPDLFPPLVALAAYCKGESKIKGVHRLTHKESDRSNALQVEFAKMGVRIEIQEDSMIIHGTEKVLGASVHSHHDHRIAMACAIAALKADGETVIEEAEAVKKSYPDFYNDLKNLGVNLEAQDKLFSNALKD